MKNSDVLEILGLTLPENSCFMCGISFDIMDDPVIDPRTLNNAALKWLLSSDDEKKILDYGNFKDVQRFEKNILTQLINTDGYGISPYTKLRFTAEELIYDTDLKAQIDVFMCPLKEQVIRLNIEKEFANTFSRYGYLFFQRPLKSRFRMSSEAVNPILQKLLHGKINEVKHALNVSKSSPMQLSELLSNTGTAEDYSGRIITDMTLLQAAAASGDANTGLILKDYMTPEEFDAQLSEIFPKGIEAHELEQKKNMYKFDHIVEAIRTAKITDIEEALRKKNNGSDICNILKKFRDEFTEISHREKIFNPHHFLGAYELCYSIIELDIQRNLCSKDRFKKSSLFISQVFGYIMRFLPTCFAHIFARGELCNIPASHEGILSYNLNLKYNNKYSYYPLSPDACSGLGFDFIIILGNRTLEYNAPGNRQLRLFNQLLDQNKSVFQRIPTKLQVQMEDKNPFDDSLSERCSCAMQ